MSTATDAPLIISLEDSLSLHEIGAQMFVPFVIDRLGGGTNRVSAELVVITMDQETQTQQSRVTLTWSAQSTATRPLPVQERVITEWGALGVACAVIPVLLGMHVLSVAVEGQRFDYRIGNEAGEHGLEVSGTLSESANDLRERHHQKIRQLRENPEHLSGFVVVVGFTRREVLISFHRPPEEKTG